MATGQVSAGNTPALLRKELAVGLLNGIVFSIVIAAIAMIWYGDIPLGLVMAYVLINVINQRAFGWKIAMTVGLEVPLTAVVFALVAALTASLYPAWRAAHNTPAMAMREE